MMLADPVARVYAEALFELARGAGATDEWAEELERIREMVDGEPEVRAFLESPVIEPAKKVAHLEPALAGRVSATVADFVCLVVRKRRFAAFGRIVEAFRAMTDEAAGRVRVHVLTATPLEDPLREQLADVLRRGLDRKVELEVSTEPALVGGAVVAIGDKIYDGSLRSRIARFKKQLSRSGVHEDQG